MCTVMPTSDSCGERGGCVEDSNPRPVLPGSTDGHTLFAVVSMVVFFLPVLADVYSFEQDVFSSKIL